MKRLFFEPRQEWQKRCEEDGFKYHSIDGEPYWREDAGYQFTLSEIEQIEAATEELHAMCMDFVNDTVRGGDYSAYGLPEVALSLIEQSWRVKDPHVYGRFDFVFKNGAVKLLEYNADTPTSLLESSVIQWTWLQDHGLPDQFNSIHEKLIARWRWPQLVSRLPLKPRIYLTTMSDAGLEDWSNLFYIADTIAQAGLDCSLVDIEKIGWDEDTHFFADAKSELIKTCFKLYPWEWMIQDKFGKYLSDTNTLFIEPAWKMLLSNKALLPILWERHPGHPLLLPAYFERDNRAETKSGRWVRKPMLAREGANLTLIENGQAKPLTGSQHNPAYDASYILQEACELPEFDGWHAVIGSWVIGDEAAGMGIREDRGLVTGNNSYFVSHYFKEGEEE